VQVAARSKLSTTKADRFLVQEARPATWCRQPKPSRPTYVANAVGTKPGFHFVGASTQSLKTSVNITLAQPFTMTAVALRTSVNSNDNLLNSLGTIVGMVFSATSGNFAAYGGTAFQITAVTETVAHVMQAFFSGASSTIFADTGGGTTTGASGIGTGGLSAGGLSTGNGTFNALTGTVFELGIWGSDKSGNYATMCANQHAYWGTSISC
jgi:hypothetical protein